MENQRFISGECSGRDEHADVKTLAIASLAPTFCPCLLPSPAFLRFPPHSRRIRTVETFSYVCLRFALAARSPVVRISSTGAISMAAFVRTSPAPQPRQWTTLPVHRVF